MRTVGVRELKNRLSEYLREVRSGERVLVTDRGAVIAEMSTPNRDLTDLSVPPGLAALARRQLLTLAAPARPGLYPSLERQRRGRWTSVRLLQAERGDR